LKLSETLNYTKSKLQLPIKSEISSLIRWGLPIVIGVCELWIKLRKLQSHVFNYFENVKLILDQIFVNTCENPDICQSPYTPNVPLLVLFMCQIEMNFQVISPLFRMWIGTWDNKYKKWW